MLQVVSLEPCDKYENLGLGKILKLLTSFHEVTAC